MKIDLFQSCGHCWVFQICWPTECSTFTASSFRIWNSSAGIPSPSLVLFIVMLSKAHLTSHSRMSGPRWVIIPLWLSGSRRCVLYSSSVYPCHLFLISSASVKSALFVLYCAHLWWNVPLVSLIFLTRSLFFPILLFSSNFLHCLVRKAFLSHRVILWNSAFRWIYLSFSPLLLLLFLSQLFVRTPQTSIFAFLHSFFLEMVLITASCTMLQTSFTDLQALYQF